MDAIFLRRLLPPSVWLPGCAGLLLLAAAAGCATARGDRALSADDRSAWRQRGADWPPVVGVLPPGGLNATEPPPFGDAGGAIGATPGVPRPGLGVPGGNGGAGGGAVGGQ